MSAVQGCALFTACRVGRESRGVSSRDPGESNGGLSSKSTCRGGKVGVCGCPGASCAQVVALGPNATSAGRGACAASAAGAGQFALVSADALLPSAIRRSRGSSVGRWFSPGGGGLDEASSSSSLLTVGTWSRQADNGHFFESGGLSRHVYVHVSQSAVALASDGKEQQQRGREGEEEEEEEEEEEGGAHYSGKQTIAIYPRPSPAETARTLTEICTDGTLCTLTEDDWPLATYVSFCLEAEGNPIIRLDPAFVHAQHVRRDSRCSLLVQLDLPGRRKLQCTLKGRLHKVEEGNARAKMELAWQQRFPAGTSGGDDDDHEIYHLQVQDVLLIPNVTSDFYGGHKEDVWISASQYSEASADPLRDCAAQIVDDMNRQQWDDIRRFVSVFSGMTGELKDAFFIWVDRLGFDMRVLCDDPQVGIRDVRIPFTREVTDERDARSSLTMMAQLAWETERMYIPPDLPLLQSFKEL